MKTHQQDCFCPDCLTVYDDVLYTAAWMLLDEEDEAYAACHLNEPTDLESATSHALNCLRTGKGAMLTDEYTDVVIALAITAFITVVDPDGNIVRKYEVAT